MANYRTKTAGRLKDAILSGLGYDPDSYTLGTKETVQYADAAQTALQTIWETHFWPFLMKSKRRQYRPTWAVDETYNTGKEVFYVEHYYRSKVDGNIGHVPSAADTTNWTTDPTDFKAYIAFTQDWEDDEIDDGGVFLPECLYEVDPLTNVDPPPIEGVRLWQRSLLVTGAAIVNRPYLLFRARCPEVSFTEWSAATSYAIGDTCYLDAKGESYVALRSTNNESPDVTPLAWLAVGVPAAFFNYVRWSAVAQLTGDDEGSAKGKLLKLADNELSRLCSVHVTQMGQQAQVRYRSRSGE